MSQQQMFVKVGRARVLEAELLIAPSADQTPWFGASERCEWFGGVGVKVVALLHP